MLTAARTCSLCAGVAITDAPDLLCFLHADTESRSSQLQDLRDGGTCWFTESTTLQQADLDLILSSAPRDHEDRPILRDARFTGCTFTGSVRFASAGHDGRLTAVRFVEFCDFESATFESDADFTEGVFDDYTSFRYATFRGIADFEQSAFLQENKALEMVEHPDSPAFASANSKRLRMLYPVSFESCQFDGPATRFAESWANSIIRFDGSTFRSVDLGPILCRGLRIRNATFTQRARIIAHGLGGVGPVELTGVDFQSSAALEGYSVGISLTSVNFTSPSTIREVQPLSKWNQLYRLEGGREKSLASTVSLKGLRSCNLNNTVSVANVDLSYCFFEDTTNLDRFRLEAGTTFLAIGGALRTRRRITAQERRWRFTKNPQWAGLKETGTVNLSSSSDADRTQDAVQVSETYRALRKGREDNKDEPGAADFYYGEMEMRRAATKGAEKTLLTAYWLVSGYGLRAWRAIVTLALFLGIISVGFEFFGFTNQGSPAHPNSVLFVLATILTVGNATNVPLTPTGEVLRLLLKVGGPLLLGLAALAVRGRIKR
ncbi:hypothetical protein SAMN05216377_110120 [Pseudonocardia oroxyli]|uniref:Pentapeptide repeat-containing protein n=1 Tax=Pseudonocardia oroxyli TaxID=366584 RepID=A0A1G7SWN4_PSEOR|nr:hypothetical protein SAMN05216377_110120 [Pseudonocardia oroxyli]